MYNNLTDTTPASNIKKKYLEDVVILRLILIFLLIWNHAFAPFSGRWDAIPGIDDVFIYKLSVLLVYNMRIQALIFISGYLLGYTSLRKPKALSFKNCIIKKIKRLILPSIIFSIIYYLIFYNLNHPINEIAYTIINGTGHLWFLPMLFWCFVGVYTVEKLKIKPIYILICSCITAIIPIPEWPYRIKEVFTFFIYFYIGFGIQRKYFNLLLPKRELKPIIICIIIYFSAFIIHYIIIANRYEAIVDNIPIINWQENISLKEYISASLSHLLTFTMSISGLLGAFWSAHYFIVGKYKLPNWLITLSTYCYGIYICQQFILEYLYYHTILPQICGTLLLPWISIIITLILSLLITFILLKTKFGRLLIG